MSSTPKLVWLDLETTGLCEHKGKILEVGIIITELDLTEVKRRSWVLRYNREAVIAMMDDYVLNMHLSSGLLKRVWTQHGPEEADRDRERRWSDIYTFMSSLSRKDCYLAGSSVHFDRAWLATHRPQLLENVSHRMLDVSTYKIAFPGMLDQPVMAPTHRVLDDLTYSIDQHRQMRTILGMESAPALVEEETSF